jgi:phosphatidylserine decarboxylase
MLGFHKEGNLSIAINSLVLLVGMAAIWLLLGSLLWLQIALSIILGLYWVIIMQFFRNPNRALANTDDSKIYAPADGKIVVIEEVEETEYFKDRRLQVSIFMSPLNVHVNRNPVNGIIRYVRYHAGLYLAAWNPKASTQNERTTVVYEANNGQQILMRQVAGALAKRIIYYVKENETVAQGQDMGFIKLGSRVDLYLPLGTKLSVKIGDVSVGNRTIIANW